MNSRILRSRDEKTQKEALVAYYKEIDRIARNQMKIVQCKRFTQVYYPTFCVAFIIIFWVVGMAKYYE